MNKTTNIFFQKICLKKIILLNDLCFKKSIHFIKKGDQKRFRKRNTLSILVFLFFYNCMIAQENNINDTISQSNKINKQELVPKNNVLKGVIYSIEDRLPLPGASIVLKNSITGTESDFDGNFKLTNIKEGDVISIYYLGYETQEIVIKNHFSLEIFMKEDQNKLIACSFAGDMNTKATYKSKRSFWQHIKSIF